MISRDLANYFARSINARTVGREVSIGDKTSPTVSQLASGELRARKSPLKGVCSQHVLSTPNADQGLEVAARGSACGNTY